MRRPHPMTVNKNGVRYIDESIHSQHRFGCIAGVALELQPGKVCYPIIDQKILDDMIAHKENLTGVEKKQGIDTCIGGIKFNSDQEVLNKDLKPIDGLYAAGVATSGFLGHGYSFPGTELGYSVYSGYTAGRLAAEQIIAKSKTV